MRTAIDIYVIAKVREMPEAASMSQEDLSEKAGFNSNGFVGQAGALSIVSVTTFNT